jgi:hypothetical protein
MSSQCCHDACLSIVACLRRVARGGDRSLMVLEGLCEDTIEFSHRQRAIKDEERDAVKDEELD